MKPWTATICTMAALASSAGAAVQEQAPPPAATPAAVKKTCRVLTPTGSFMGTRVCNTQAQWDKFDGHNAAGVSDFRRALNMTSTNERKEGGN